MKKLLKLASTAAVSASLITGVAAAQSVNFDTTGPNSNNQATNNTTNTSDVDQSNGALALNLNAQEASSGEASAEHNTTVSNVGSGSASNSNSTSTSVSQSNSGGAHWTMPAGDGQSVSMIKTGPNSNNQATNNQTNKLEVEQTNTAAVLNINLQGASSGDASAEHNTTVGNVMSGNASNSNTTSTAISQSNN